MRRERSSADIDRIAQPEAHVIAQGPDWCVSEFICRADATCRPFEERHQWVTIAAVMEGLFNYRADTGKALLHPGALMLGNHGTCFECGHEHSAGDRCIGIQIAPDYFEEIAAGTGVSARYKFPSAMMPSADGLLPQIAHMERLSSDARPRMAEAVPEIVSAVIKALSGTHHGTVRISPQDKMRVSRALHYIEANISNDIGLDDLAEVAGMSKYHFLRTFRKVVGVTPYQHILTLRMRHAAVRLAKSRETIAAICYDAGFGDLSTFNQRFRTVFGVSPAAFRRAEGV